MRQLVNNLMFIDGLLRFLGISQKPTSQPIENGNTQFSVVGNENPILTSVENEKIDQVLKDTGQLLTEVKSLYIKMVQHDQHLSQVDTDIIARLSELAVRKNEVPESKKLDIERILSESNTRQEAIDKLKSIGIPQSSAYRYTEVLKAENEKKIIIKSEN